MNKKSNEQIYQDLLTDSQALFFAKKIYLDFFLEIFKMWNNEKGIKLFTKSFNLEKIIFPKELQYNDYSPMLKIIENNPNIIIQYCSETEDKNQYYILIYMILFFVRFHYDREKTNEMLNNKNIWQYLIKILPNKYNFFPKLILPEELIHKMFEQDLTCKIINGILSFCDSIEKVLVLINDKINLISSCCSNEKSTIVMSSLEKCQKNDNIEKVIEEVEKIIKYEKDNSIFFISFDVDFWNYYIHLIDDIKKLFSFIFLFLKNIK